VDQATLLVADMLPGLEAVKRSTGLCARQPHP
jgi:hypothetical protein